LIGQFRPNKNYIDLKERWQKAFSTIIKIIIMNTNNSHMFYNGLLRREIGKSDIRNIIDEITQGDLVKLKALENDFEMYLYKDLNPLVMYDPVMNHEEEEKEWEEPSYSIRWQGKEICKIKIPKSRVGSEGQFIAQPVFPNHETLPNADHILVCDVINLLQRKIRELQNKNQHKNTNLDISEKLISFNSPETIDKIHKELKGYFPKKEKELLKALNGERLTERLLFPHNQNKFVEVFKRMKYNGLLISSYTEITSWLCNNFNFRYQKGEKIEVRPFNENSVRDIFKNSEKEPKKIERICKNDTFIPYKTSAQRKETE